MCLTCGCSEPNNSHGDTRNITLNDLARSGDAQGIALGQVIINLIKSLKLVVVSLIKS